MGRSKRNRPTKRHGRSKSTTQSGQMSLPFNDNSEAGKASTSKKPLPRGRKKKGRGRGRIRPVRIVKVRSFNSKVLGKRIHARDIGLPVITFVFDESDPNCEMYAEFISINRK